MSVFQMQPVRPDRIGGGLMADLVTLKRNEISFAGDVIAELEQRGISVERKAILSLIGGDFTRVNAFLRTCAIGSFYEAIEGRDARDVGISFAGFRAASKGEALRTFALFPRTIIPNEVKPYSADEKQEILDLNWHYAGIGLWLLNWHKGGRYCRELKKMGLVSAEKPAWVSRFRYDVCDWLKSHSQNPYIQAQSTAATWLLFESSICRIRLGERPKFRSKRQRYDLTGQILSCLDDLNTSQLEKDIPANPRDVVNDFAGLCLFEAKKLARDDRGFDTLIWQRYLKAEKTWGRESLRRKGLTAFM